MRVSFAARVFLAATILVIVLQANPCSFPIGYFYQVTRLRGKVVGANSMVLQSMSWLRQSFARKNVMLTLYSYRWPINSRDDLPLVKTVKADGQGNFDFGALENGHYTLVIDDAEWGRSDRFDVQVRSLPQPTDSVTIDISPVAPDCSGGHEFIVKRK